LLSEGVRWLVGLVVGGGRDLYALPVGAHRMRP
jgi:hypothetical protein